MLPQSLPLVVLMERGNDALASQVGRHTIYATIVLH